MPPPADPLLPANIPSDADELAAALDQALATACPVTALDDERAHAACADALTSLPLLQQRMSEPFQWGGQASVAATELEQSNRTDFNPRIWRRLYLATFAFPGGHTVEARGATTVIRIPIVFRDGLDPGSFPYPFWHSPTKWASYETAREMLFFVRASKIVGALRSAETDPNRPRREMKWDGQWTWTTAGGPQPRVTLFSHAFSPANPHVATVDQTYRALEKELRAENCISCHSPDNAAKMNPLELFSYPNQALSGRRQLVDVLTRNTMPPGAGIASGDRRSELLELARQFADAGDAALAFDEAAAAP